MTRLKLPIAATLILTLLSLGPSAHAHAFQSSGFAFRDGAVGAGADADADIFVDAAGNPQHTENAEVTTTVYRALVSAAVAGPGMVVVRLLITDFVTEEEIVNTAFQAASNAIEGESVPPPVNTAFFVDGTSFGFDFRLDGTQLGPTIQATGHYQDFRLEIEVSPF